MDITQLLEGTLGNQVLDGISNQVGTSQKDTQAVIGAALPVVMGMLQKNASNEQGAASLLGALGKHDGSILNNLPNYINSGDLSDGVGILKHVLGGKQGNVENAISKNTGVSQANVGKIIAILAPIIMGKLGQQQRANQANTGGGIVDILGGLLQNGGASQNSVGGSILSSVLGQVLGGNQGSNSNSGAGGALGNILGNIFGKK